MIGVQGKQLSSSEKQFIAENNIGGVVLFSRNLESLEQLHELCREIQELHLKQVDRSPLFIAVDQEGGRVQRFKTNGFSHWPPLALAGELDNPAVTFQWAQLLSQELRCFGINLNFAPALDVLTNSANKVIGDRSISTDFRKVEKHASAWVRGALKASLLSCAKHFPGHGNTLLDSHEDLPREGVSRETLLQRELIPFKKAFRSKVDFVMMAHIIFEKLDPHWPASLSQMMIRDLLRNEMGFRGLIFTDDLDMGALRKHFSVEEIPIHAVQAGCDILLYCNEPESYLAAMESLIGAVAQGRLDSKRIQQVHARIQNEKKEKLGGTKQMTLEECKKILSDPKKIKFIEDLRAKKSPDLSPFQTA
jgi:beta-N-acetylhexosaminidase